MSRLALFFPGLARVFYPRRADAFVDDGPPNRRLERVPGWGQRRRARSADALR